MEKHIMYNGINYTLHGDYYFPDLEYHTTYYNAVTLLCPQRDRGALLYNENPALSGGSGKLKAISPLYPNCAIMG